MGRKWQSSNEINHWLLFEKKSATSEKDDVAKDEMLRNTASVCMCVQERKREGKQCAGKKGREGQVLWRWGICGREPFTLSREKASWGKKMKMTAKEIGRNSANKHCQKGA